MFKLKCPGDERGISEVLGAILVLGMVIGVGSVIYTQYLQSSIHSSEADHMNAVGEAFIKQKSSIATMGIGQSSIANIPMNTNFPPLVPIRGEVGTLSIFPGIAYHKGATSYTIMNNQGHVSGSLNALKADDGSYLEVNQVIFEEKFPSTSGWTMYEVLPDNDGDAFWDSYGYTSGDGTGSISVTTASEPRYKNGKLKKGKTDPTSENAYWEHDFGGSLDSQSYPNVTLRAMFGKKLETISIPINNDNAAWWIEVENVAANPDTYVSSYAVATGSLDNFDNQKQENGGWATLSMAYVDNDNNITNGAFATNHTGWSWTESIPEANHAWASAGYANGGSENIYCANKNKNGEGYIYQSLPTGIKAGSTVRLFYAWLKDYKTVYPTQQDIFVTLVKPSGATVDIDSQLGAPAAYNTWYVVDKDISSFFTESGTYKIRMRYDFQTPNMTGAEANAKFDEVRIMVNNYQLDVFENVGSIVADYSYKVQLNFRLDNNKENFRVQVQNASNGWDNFDNVITYRGGNWTTWENNVNSSYIVSNTVRLRFVGNSGKYPLTTNLQLDYVRVKKHNWNTVLSYNVNGNGVNEPIGTPVWNETTTLQTLKNGIEGGINKIRAHMYSYLDPKNKLGTYFSLWTDEITLFDGPPFDVSIVLTSNPIIAPENLDSIVENLAFFSNYNSAYYTLQIQNSHGDWENFNPVKQDNVGLNKVYWVETIGGVHATTQYNDPRNYIYNDVINMMITGHNDNLPFSLCLDYLDFQVNYKENSENYLASFYGGSGKLTFTMINYSYPNQTYIYDDGAVIVAQSNSSAMASGGAPTPDLMVVTDMGSNNIRVDVNHFALTGSGRSISRGGWSAIRATVVDSYYLNQGANVPNVSIDIYTSPSTDQAWVNYLSGLFDDFIARGYNSTFSKDILADTDGEHLTLTIYGNISYYEKVTQIQVQLA